MTKQNLNAKAEATEPHPIMNIVSVIRGPSRCAAPFIGATAYKQPKEIHMSDDEKKLMVRYGITSTSKMIYSYKQHRYENITDALRFAELDSMRAQEGATGKSR